MACPYFSQEKAKLRSPPPRSLTPGGLAASSLLGGGGAQLSSGLPLACLWLGAQECRVHASHVASPGAAGR